VVGCSTRNEQVRSTRTLGATPRRRRRWKRVKRLDVGSPSDA
jgi:hypothetical protein